MKSTLLSYVNAHTLENSGSDGVAQTAVSGLSTVRAEQPRPLIHAVSKPAAVLILQGQKEVATNFTSQIFQTGDSLLITANLPTESRIVEASSDTPYLSVVIELDVALIADLMGEMGLSTTALTKRVSGAPTDEEVADAALRLMRMIGKPETVKILQSQLMRELHYWLLAGRHGPAVCQLGGSDSHAQRIARAVALLRSKFDRPLPVDQLASEAGMSPSAFHEHFKTITSLSPLQFQKRLRLVEARRLMISEGLSANASAFAVGYASVPQFTRDYGRVFKLPPAQDARKAMSS